MKLCDVVLDKLNINEQKKTVELKNMNDLVKMKNLPDKITVDGVIYRIGGGSASSLSVYLRKEQKAPSIDIYPSSFDNPSDVQRKSKSFKLQYKIKGLSFEPWKVLPE